MCNFAGSSNDAAFGWLPFCVRWFVALFFVFLVHIFGYTFLYTNPLYISFYLSFFPFILNLLNANFILRVYDTQL